MVPSLSFNVLQIIFMLLCLLHIFTISINHRATAARLTPSSTNKTEIIIRKQFLDGHNAARKAVGVPPLKWEPKLATYALVYANERRKDCKLVHSPGFDYGENLFWGQGKQWSAANAVDAWVKEKQWYHYANNSCDGGKECSHYTQIVWRTTERVGCSKIICHSGDVFIACEYFPPGNYVGERPY